MDIQQLHLTRLVVCGALECHNKIISDALDLLQEHQQTEAIAYLNSLEAGLMWLAALLDAAVAA